MDKIVKIARNYPLTTILTCAIWVVCLIPIPETPLSGVSLIDKWTHIVMFLTLSFTVAFEYWRNNNGNGKKIGIKPLALYAWLMPILMGGLVEIVQGTCTNGVRSGDWLDFLTDVLGSTIAIAICILPARFGSRD